MQFSKLDLPEFILKAVDRMGFEDMTEVQEKAIPLMIEGRDMVAKAPTGTGKTCAFGIPLLVGIDAESKATQCLVLAPTRELAQQITADLRELSHFMPGVRTACIYGGQAFKLQTEQLKRGAQIIVATPGRLLDHMNRRTVDLRGVSKIILDEADEMLDMGFYKDVRKIIESLKNRKQMGMFSATISREVMDISWLYQRDPVEITVQPIEASMPKIAQYAILTTGRGKLDAIRDILTQFGYERVMIFCGTKYTTAMLAGQLKGMGLDADGLHGDMTQSERNAVMTRFREGALRLLVSTDVAARGIDVDDVDAVINYDLPSSNAYYTHRIGRTGRARREGVAYILYVQDEERKMREMLRLTRNTVVDLCFSEDRKLAPVSDSSEA